MFVSFKQDWWSKASKIGLNKKKFIQGTKCLIFNLQHSFNGKRKCYKNNIIFPDSDEKYSNFDEYFEEAWIAFVSNIKIKFEFNIWIYNNKL